MGIVLNDNLSIQAGKPADAKYLNSSNATYTNVAAAKSAIPVSYRYPGLTVNVGTDEYWWKTGLTDGDLVLKTLGTGFVNPMTTQGDLIVGGSSGTPQRLGIGTALQQVRVNSGGTALEYFTPSAGSGITFKEQNFTGDGTTSTFVVSNGTVDQLSFVDINGNVQENGVNYTITGQNVVFSTAIPTGDIITVHYAQGSGGGGGGSVTAGDGITVSGSIVSWGGNIASDIFIEDTTPNTNAIHFGQTNNLLSFDFTVGDGTFVSAVSSVGSTISFTSTNSSTSDSNSLVVDVNAGSVFTDNRATPTGLTYASNGYVRTSTSLTDQGYIANLFNGVRGLTLVNLSPGIDTVSLGGHLASSVIFRDPSVGSIDIGFGTTGNRVRSFTTQVGNGSTLSDYTQSVSSFQWSNFNGSGSSQINFDSTNGWVYTDSNSTPVGLKYSADYRTGYGSRTIPDWGNVLSAKTYTGKQTFVQTTTTASANLGGFSTDPSSALEGDIGYNTTSHQLKFYNGSSWTTASGGPPAGASGQIQFNNSGSFGADASFLYDASSNVLKINPPVPSNYSLIEFPTLDSTTPDTPTNYGSFRFTKQDGTYKNADGRYDAVCGFSWNGDGGGTPVIPTEATMGWRLENHFDPGDIGQPQFEFHIESTTNLATGNLKNRHFSILVNKASGNATSYWKTNSMDWFLCNQDLTYFSVSPASATVTGIGVQGILNVTNNGPDPGYLTLSTDTDGGTSTIINNSDGFCQISGRYKFIGTDINGLDLKMNTGSNANGYSVSTDGSSGTNYPFISSGSIAGGSYWKNENTSSSGGADAFTWMTTNGGSALSVLDAGSFRMISGIKPSDGKYQIGKTYGFGSNVFFTIDQSGQVAIPTLTTPGILVNDASGNLSTSFGPNIGTIASTTTLDGTYDTVLCNAGGGAITINLPPASSYTKKVYTIKKIDSSGHAITIDGNGSETIDGSTTQVISFQWSLIRIQSDGTAWYIIGQ